MVGKISYFANDTQTLTLTSGEADSLDIENGAQCVVVSGSVSITRDKRGLDVCQRLMQELEAMMAVLKNETLPEKIDLPHAPTGQMANPFLK